MDQSKPFISRGTKRQLVLACLFWGIFAVSGDARDHNRLIVETIAAMPAGGSYASYDRTQPGREFEELYDTVGQLDDALNAGLRGRLRVEPERAGALSFCSSATYLLFLEVLERLQDAGELELDRRVAMELVDVGGREDVIHGRLDGIGLFGHWNADGPGTAVLFHRLGLGRNFTSFEEAKPGDFLKIFWNDKIGKGERGHLVVYLGTSSDGRSIQVWSSNLKNSDGGSGYGTMWVERTRIIRQVFSRLQFPENLNRWGDFSEEQKRSDYLIEIRRSGSSYPEMLRVVGAEDAAAGNVR